MKNKIIDIEQFVEKWFQRPSLSQDEEDSNYEEMTADLTKLADSIASKARAEQRAEDVRKVEALKEQRPITANDKLRMVGVDYALTALQSEEV